MKGKKALFTSARPDWQTDPAFIRAVEKKLFGTFKRFQLDAAAEQHNSICRYFLKDAFKEHWPRDKRIFVNPPYGKTDKHGTSNWLAKAMHCHAAFLLPARTDTIWFQRFSIVTDILLIKGRLTFYATTEWIDPKDGKVYAPVSLEESNPAPFPSCLFTFPGSGKIETWDWRSEQ